MHLLHMAQIPVVWVWVKMGNSSIFGVVSKKEKPGMEYSFTAEEIQEINRHAAKYPDRKSAVMPALWIAQTKFGWLPKEAIQLVADTIDMSFAQVYGVATFYTMYFKKPMPRFVLDICTCFTCGETGGSEVYQHARKYLNCDAEGYSEDRQFFVRQAECLGACDTAPVMQVTNGHYVHRLTNESIEKVIDDMRRGSMPQFVSIPLNKQA